MNVYIGKDEKKPNIKIYLDVDKTITELREKEAFLECEIEAFEGNTVIIKKLKRELNSVISDMCYITQLKAHQPQPQTI